MGFLFGHQSAPPPPPPPPSILPPGVNNLFAQASGAAARARAAFLSGFGDGGTLLTGGQGVGSTTTTKKDITGTVTPKQTTGE